MADYMALFFVKFSYRLTDLSIAQFPAKFSFCAVITSSSFVIRTKNLFKAGSFRLCKLCKQRNGNPRNNLLDYASNANTLLTYAINAKNLVAYASNANDLVDHASNANNLVDYASNANNSVDYASNANNLVAYASNIIAPRERLLNDVCKHLSELSEGAYCFASLSESGRCR